MYTNCKTVSRGRTVKVLASCCTYTKNLVKSTQFGRGWLQFCPHRTNVSRVENSNKINRKRSFAPIGQKSSQSHEKRCNETSRSRAEGTTHFVLDRSDPCNDEMMSLWITFRIKVLFAPRIMLKPSPCMISYALSKHLGLRWLHLWCKDAKRLLMVTRTTTTTTTSVCHMYPLSVYTKHISSSELLMDLTDFIYTDRTYIARGQQRTIPERSSMQ